jgi:hypothetical protein
LVRRWRLIGYFPYPRIAANPLQVVIDAVMRVFLEAVETDDDHDAVSTALCGAAELLTTVGGVAMAAYLDKLLAACTEVVTEEVMCLQVRGWAAVRR